MSEVVLPNEIWQLIGAHTGSRRTLSSLSRVSRGFQSIFAPLLYQHYLFKIRLWQSREGVVPLSSFYSSGGCHAYLRFTKYLEIDTNIVSGHQNDDDQVIVALDEIRKQLFACEKNIESLSWVLGTIDQNARDVLLYSDIFDILKCSAHLRSISIQFPDPYGISAHGQMGMPPSIFCAFENLTCLELFNLHGSHVELCDEIASLLGRCPGLKTLGLGLGCSGNALRRYPVVRGAFLAYLCTTYGEKFGPKLLSLQILRLGFGFGLFAPLTPFEEGPCLELLTTIESIEVLHLWNGSISCNAYQPGFHPSLVFNAFTGGKCKVRQLSLTAFSDKARDFLITDGKSVTELIITSPCKSVSDRADSGNRDWECSAYEYLPSGQLSLLFHREKHDLKRLFPALVLESFEDLGVSLTRLGLSLNFEVDWDDFIICLTRLNNLTQLRIEPKIGYEGPFPHPDSAFSPLEISPEQIAHTYALLITFICPDLKFIKIGQWAWENLSPSSLCLENWFLERGMARDDYGLSGHKLLSAEEIASGSASCLKEATLPIAALRAGKNLVNVDELREGMKLRLLDWDEVRNIELFAIADDGCRMEACILVFPHRPPRDSEVFYRFTVDTI